MSTYVCANCGQLVEHNRSFHPHLYCALYKVGISDQAHYLRAALDDMLLLNIGWTALINVDALDKLQQTRLSHSASLAPGIGELRIAPEAIDDIRVIRVTMPTKAKR